MLFLYPDSGFYEEKVGRGGGGYFVRVKIKPAGPKVIIPSRGATPRKSLEF